MCEINRENFENCFHDIKKSLETAKFIGIDLEFSALNPLDNSSPSLFDTPRKRYAKLRKNVEFTIPLQIGISAFQFDANKNKYSGDTFSFHVKPCMFTYINRYFYFETASLEFLALHNFDFNKFVYSGIPFLSKIQEQELRSKLRNHEIDITNSNFPLNIKSIVQNHSITVSEWYKEANVGDSFKFPELPGKFGCNYEIKYFIHQHFRKSFKYLWTYELNNDIYLKKVTEEEYLNLDKGESLNEELMKNLLGFGRIYNLLTTLKKPMIAHNALMDLLILINNFEGFLPASYDEFKKLVNKLFPLVIDTKHLCYNLKKTIPEKKQWEFTDLKFLFEYFKDGMGRHLALHSPPIEIQSEDSIIGNYHNAGWDSFCAGYIFIRMAFLHIHESHPKSKVFMPVELIKGVQEYVNRVNVIRATVNHINLAGPDPDSTRPPLLVVETIRNARLNLKELSYTLGAYGNIEIKQLTWARNKAIIAVENYGSARSVLRGLNGNPKFRVKQYSFLRHSPLAQVALWSGVTMTGVALVWYLRSNLNK